MTSWRQAGGAVLPRRLMQQVLALAALVIIVSGTIYSVIAARRIDEMGRVLLETQAAGLAHSVASGGALHLVNGDPGGLERLLLKSAAYPGVRTITVVNRIGRIAAAVKQDAGGNPVADFDLQAMPVPSDAAAQRPGYFDNAGEAVIEAYAPIENGTRLGWVRVTVGLEKAAQVSRDARRDTLLGVLSISVLTLAVLYAFFRHALQPLTRCIEFAGRLGNSLGESLRMRHTTVESETLARALNAASAELDGRMNALRQSEARMRQFMALVNASDDAIISQTLDGIVLSWNPGAERMFGYPAASMIGRSIAAIVPPERSSEQTELFAALAAEAKVINVETQRRHRDGHLIEVSSTLSPILDESGKVIGISKITRDITQRNAAQAARIALEGQLRESQKMEAIGTLAGGIAHDFNNIIAAILGNAELALEDSRSNPQRVAESVEEVIKAGRRGRDVVKQILSFSRRQPTERKPVALDVVVAECGRLLRASMPARVEIEVQCEAGVPAVLADATQIQQVLINLATNSMLAMQGRAGRIEMQLASVSPDAALLRHHPALAALRERQGGPLVRLSVRDDGMGMTAETLAKIFEPFFTTRPAGEGTGLGLAVVHGIVQTHEGAITVESTPGKGTTFAVYLPPVAAPAAAMATPPVPAAQPRSEGGDRHILYLDDEEALVFLVKRLLGRRGYRVSGYSNQDAALGALRAAPAQFDMVVTDYNMPGMSGLDVAREVRALSTDMPVVVVTGFIDENLPQEAAEAGVAEVVFKASEADVLCETLIRVLNDCDAKRAAR